MLFVSLIAVGLSLLMDFQWGDVAERIGRFICCWFIDPVARLLKTKRREEVLAPQDEPETVDTDASIVPIVRVVDDDTQPAAFVETLARADAFSASVPASAGPAVQAAPRASKHADCPLSMSLLDDPPAHREANSADDLQMTGRLIVSKLKSYGIEASIGGIQPGPVITQYWLEPGPGVKGSQIDNVRDDLRRTLGVQAVRVVPSIPNTSFIGLEVPNPVRETVRLKEILESKAFRESTAPLTLALGKDIGGKAFVIDLAKMPHLLVAGTTGSGKSVGINAMILSMLYRNSPADLRLVLIDPKMLEFSLYNGIPHLLCPVVTDMNKAASALKWLTREMDRRYAVMSRMGVRHFNNYNEKIRRAAENGETIPDPLQSPEDPVQKPLEALHRLHRRRTRGPHAHEPQGGRGRDHQTHAEGPCSRHSYDHRDPASVGRCGDKPHQGKRAHAHLLPGGFGHRQPRDSGRVRRRVPARLGRHAPAPSRRAAVDPHPGVLRG